MGFFDYPGHLGIKVNEREHDILYPESPDGGKMVAIYKQAIGL